MAVDPWFNFRATKYLVQNGFYSFWDWFDDREASNLLHGPISSIGWLQFLQVVEEPD